MKIPNGKTIDPQTGRTTFDSDLHVVHPASWEYLEACGALQVRMGLNWGDVMHAQLRALIAMFDVNDGNTPEEKDRLRNILIECIQQRSMEPMEREMARALSEPVKH
jgi:hypothetical protein